MTSVKLANMLAVNKSLNDHFGRNEVVSSTADAENLQILQDHRADIVAGVDPATGEQLSLTEHCYRLAEMEATAQEWRPYESRYRDWLESQWDSYEIDHWQSELDYYRT